MTTSYFYGYRILNWRRVFWPWHFVFDCPPDRVHTRIRRDGTRWGQCECGYRWKETT